MFTSKQEESWINAHLKLCQWYVEMPKDETPLHKEENMPTADPLYSWSNVGAASRATNANATPAQGTTTSSKAAVKGSSAKGPDSKTKTPLKGSK